MVQGPAEKKAGAEIVANIFSSQAPGCSGGVAPTLPNSPYHGHPPFSADAAINLGTYQQIQQIPEHL
ncbi:hypothetical protein M407DRAFT_35101 [Tulasnella calospora MUT 4182]|uniref:Uncharacterized protein n=1 Tax=Tulasnella calospora MUT 4182 TaxID=1051891 RepID=A0A0C3L0X0_9AGAM|nr:hypothetical protein M407DRAFT_35101 [Tulasnella calospora MUT 4182]